MEKGKVAKIVRDELLMEEKCANCGQPCGGGLCKLCEICELCRYGDKSPPGPPFCLYEENGQLCEDFWQE